MQYYGQRGIDRVLNERFLKGKESGFFIDCGGFDGVLESNTLCLYKYLNWRGISLEPVPIIYEALAKNRPEDNNINAALSSQNGVATFTQAISSTFNQYGGNFGNGSLSHEEGHLNGLKRYCAFEQFEVETLTLPELYKRYQIDKEVDLFSLDVEGHEIQVLSKMGEVEKALRPKFLVVEYNHCGKHSLEAILKDLSYEPVYADELNMILEKK